MSFFDNLETFGKGIAVIEPDNQRYSYDDLVSHCNDFEGEIGSAKKKLVLILCENRIGSLVAYLAALRTDNVALLVDATINSALLDELVEIYVPDFIWNPGAKGFTGYDTCGQDNLLQCKVSEERPVHKELCLLLSTSGSTGSPKLVKLTRRNLDTNAKAIAEYLGLNGGNRPITTLPMHYSYGLSVINSHLAVGGTILLTNDSIMTRQFWDFFRLSAATSLAGVPYTYEMLKKLRFFKMNMTSLKTITQAGGRLSPELALEFAEFSHRKGIEFFIMYGQTEATARISYLPPQENLKKYRSVGIPIPGGSLIIVNEAGETVNEPFSEGELVYYGENVMMGYANCREDLGKGDELGGRLMTGDIGYYDNEGFFYVTGRKKRFIKIFGNRVNLDDIEGFLKKQGLDCACEGSDDHLSVFYVKGGKQQDIRKMIVERFGFHISVVETREVKAINRSSSGKVQYNRKSDT
jgi:acyl-CoA synthetase (AMP-forming)/AMP-acid ligase II